MKKIIISIHFILILLMFSIYVGLINVKSVFNFDLDEFINEINFYNKVNVPPVVNNNITNGNCSFARQSLNKAFNFPSECIFINGVSNKSFTFIGTSQQIAAFKLFNIQNIIGTYVFLHIKRGYFLEPNLSLFYDLDFYRSFNENYFIIGSNFSNRLENTPEHMNFVDNKNNVIKDRVTIKKIFKNRILKIKNSLPKKNKIIFLSDLNRYNKKTYTDMNNFYKQVSNEDENIFFLDMNKFFKNISKYSILQPYIYYDEGHYSNRALFRIKDQFESDFSFLNAN